MTISKLVKEAYSSLKTGIGLKREKGLEASLSFVAGSGIQKMTGEIRSVSYLIEKEEQNLLIKRQARAQKTKDVMELVTVCGIVASGAIFVLLMLLFRKSIRAGISKWKNSG